MLLFYVVYLVDADDFIVIPCTWIRDDARMLEKFVNYGLNTAQTHLCFWSTNADAITQNGQPNFRLHTEFRFRSQSFISKC